MQINRTNVCYNYVQNIPMLSTVLSWDLSRGEDKNERVHKRTHKMVKIYEMYGCKKKNQKGC